MMTIRTLRGKVVVAGIGETEYYKHGKSPDPEFVLALKAILAAAADACIDPRDIDGFSSYSDDRNDPLRLATAFNCRELRFSCMQWGGGGGGAAGAMANAAAAIAGGLAECVVVHRALAQGQFSRYGRGAAIPTVTGDAAFRVPYGIMSPAQKMSFKVQRFMHEHGVHQSALRAIALASYTHAQNNPRAVMYGKPLTPERYDESRWIAEPFHLYDCCMENDGAAAIIVMSAERAKYLPHRVSYILGAASGAARRSAATSFNAPYYASAHFTTVAPKMWEMARVGPKDVNVIQSYENFTGGVLMSLVEHGFFTGEEANDVLTIDNLLAPNGRLPLNTSGGNLAECYMHGLELQIEAIRQIRGQSPNQVRNVDVALASAGPMVTPVSTIVFGSDNTL
jgi:acetyl-CoA acetyltransferase